MPQKKKTFQSEFVDPYIRMMFGAYAIKIPMRLTVQDQGEGIASFVGISNDTVRFGSAKTHQLVMCDAVIRPHLVLETDDFRGAGLGALATTQLWEWEDKPIALNPFGLDTNNPMEAYGKLMKSGLKL